MSGQWKIDLILNICMISLYNAEDIMHFSSTIFIKSKIGDKILSQKHGKTSFYRQSLI